MSQSQLGLASLLGVIILLGLPAFVLPQPTVVDTSASPESSPSRSLSVPSTTLSLQKTSEKRREEIRHARKININEASKKELQTIPKIGPNYAEDIVNYRKKGNTFHSISDLTAISGFGKRTVNSIREHIKVGEEHRGEGGATAKNDKLDINRASVEELKTLPGIGTVTAERIVTYREENKAIKSREDLDEIPGIGSGMIEKILPEIKKLPGGSSAVGSSKTNLNTASRSELSQLPGIGNVTAGRIIDYRNRQGSFGSIEDLERISGIGQATIDGLRDKATVR